MKNEKFKMSTGEPTHQSESETSYAETCTGKEDDALRMVNPKSLIPNKMKLEIYQVPKNYEEIKLNIEKEGIIEPLLVIRDSNVIISGNLRHQIALELGLEEIPVLFREISEKEMDVKSISTNHQRIKSHLDLFREIEFFEKEYPVKKGQRTDLDPKLKKQKEKRDASLSKLSRTKKEQLKAIGGFAKELYGKDSKEYEEVFDSLDRQNNTLNGTYHRLKDLSQRKKNEEVIPKRLTISKETYKIYDHSSDNMSEVDSGSVYAIITSPPYFKMRDYGNGEDELGQEKQIDQYLQNLMKVFEECYRVLRDDGSLFVNINDCVIDGEYQAVTHQFVIEMRKLGWIYNDELQWIKNNPQYNPGNRSIRSHEPIYMFVKSSKFYYNIDWLKDITDDDGKMSIGTGKSSPKLRSGIDYQNGVLKTNAANTSKLRKRCKEEGFHLTHSATFPLSVPTVCGLMSTKVGDTILDCFAGTSTVGKFAKEYGRKFIGYEMNPEFIKASEIRLNDPQFYTQISELDDSRISLYDEIIDLSVKQSESFSKFNTAFKNCFQLD